MNSPALRSPFARLAAALPDLGLAGAFLVTWLEPFRLGERMVAYFMLVMLLEFIVVHSSGFMGFVVLNESMATHRKVLALVGLGAFYCLFAGGFGASFGAWWPVWTILLMTLNRIAGVFLSEPPRGDLVTPAMSVWGFSVLCYVVFAFATTLLPIPRLGITPAVQAAQQLSGGGLWVDEPHRVIAFGVLYFAAVGLFELRGLRLPGQPSKPDDPEKGERGPTLRERWRRRQIRQVFQQDDAP